jgi:hypothetical protein
MSYVDFYCGNAFIQLPSHLWDGKNDLDLQGFSQTFGLFG